MGTQDPPGRSFLWTLRGLALVAVAISGYLLWVSVMQADAAGCGPESGPGGCDDVLASRWSLWLGLPVSGGAMLTYAAVFGATFWLGERSVWQEKRRAWVMLLTLSLMVVGAGAWFVGVQTVAVKALCPHCIAVHLCGLLIAILVVIRLPLGLRSGAGGRGRIRWRHLLGSSSVGAIAVASLVSGQVLVEDVEPLLVFERFDGDGEPAVPPVSTPGKSLSSGGVSDKVNSGVSDTINGRAKPQGATDAAAPGLRPKPQPVGQPVNGQLSLYNGQHVINLAQVPMHGPRDAPFVAVEMFDYTCPHCQRLYVTLEPLEERLNGQVAVVLSPLPLDAACNRFIRPDRSRANACKYVTLALGVWRADPQLFEQFHRWLFQPPPPPYQFALDHARKLVGREQLDAALKDPWIKQYIADNVDLYALAGSGKIPKIIVGDKVTSPHPPSKVYAWLEKQLELPPSAQEQ